MRCRAPVARQAHNLEVGGSIPPGAISRPIVVTATLGWPWVLRRAAIPAGGFPGEPDPPSAFLHRRADLLGGLFEGGEDLLDADRLLREGHGDLGAGRLEDAGRAPRRAPPPALCPQARRPRRLTDGLADGLGGGVPGQVLVDDPPDDLALSFAVLQLGDLVGRGGRDRAIVDLALELGRKGQERERLADRALADVELAREFLGGPPVEVHELPVGAGLLDRPEVLAEEILDDL